MYLLGIDENGLGLTNQAMLGPLVISAVGFEFKENNFPLKVPFEFRDSILVDDSKKVFKRNQKSYKILEKTALNFISLLRKSSISNFDLEIFKEFNIEIVPCNLEGLCFFQKPFSLPLWTENYLELDLEKFLEQNGIRFIYFRFIMLCPKLLYKKDKYKQEVLAFSKIILDWQKVIDSDKYKIFCGNIKNYSKTTIENYWIENNIMLDSAKIEFITKGDAKEFVMALASILGKYIREIFIERINRYFSFYDKDIPYCAGYRQNEKFDDFLDKAEIVCKRNNVDLRCLVRDYNFYLKYH